MEDEAIAAQLEQLVTPAVIAQERYYRQLGMRDRILNLRLMVAAVLTLIWRDVAGVRELTRILNRGKIFRFAICSNLLDNCTCSLTCHESVLPPSFRSLR